MGQFEKIVVLVALLLVTTILVVTFTTEEDPLALSMNSMEQAQLAGPEGAGPAVEAEGSRGELLARDRSGDDQNARTRRDRRGAGTLAGPEDDPRALGAVAHEELSATEESPNLGIEDLGLQALMQKERDGQGVAEVPSKGDLLLDDSYDAGASAGAAGIPEGAALLTLTGLRETWEEDLKEYVWRKGDSWADIAERYYGDRRKVELLRQFNEGQRTPRTGDAILVPVFDGRERNAEVITSVDEQGAEFYEVVDGDSLWGISKKVYGKGHLWERIFEANGNLLKSPDDVQPGMELYIP